MNPNLANLITLFSMTTKLQTEKEFYIETKHYVYVDYTIRARDKEHALEQFENGSYDDINTDYGIYDEQIVKITEENTEQQLSLSGVF